MAIYHLSTKLIQRSKGHNVVAAAAYRHASKMHAEKEGRVFDFSKKQDVIFGEILVPDNAPEWIKQFNALPTVESEPSHDLNFLRYDKEAVSEFSEKLWNMVENLEIRKDAQLARDIEFSLPKELTPLQNIALAREFLKDQLCARGMVADWSFHNDEGNPHIHVLASLRSLTPEGFGQKVRAWNAKEMLHTLREQWAAYANFHLKLHQHDVTIDHRSYEAQGIDLIPTKKEGKAIRQMRERGIPTERMHEASAIKQENISRIAQNPQILFDKMTKTSPTFTQGDVAHEMGRYISDRQTVNYQGSAPNKGLLADAALHVGSDLGGGAKGEAASESISVPVLSIEKLTALLKKIEMHESVFSEKTLVRALSEMTDNADLFAKALLEIKASPELVYLGAGDDGRDRYTTKAMFGLENRLQSLADKWGNHCHFRLNHSLMQATLAAYEAKTGKPLTPEQQRAVKHITGSGGITCLVGRAGTGKSFSLGAARAIWEAQGLNIMGIALSGKAADSLAKDAAIESRTIDSFRYAIEKGKLLLKAGDVVVMDEAGMTDSISMESVLSSVVNAGAKLVLVGDHAQLQPVGPGSSFRALVERLGFAEIQTVYRQKTQWQREATVHFAAGQIEQGLGLYHDSSIEAIRFEDKPDEAMQMLVKDWAESVKMQENGLQESMIMSYRNVDVAELNRLARSLRLASGEISEGYRMKTAEGEILLSAGDRIMLLKNNRPLGLSNGRLATVVSVDMTEGGAVNTLTILPDGVDTPVTINPEEYNHLSYGYAATVHKLQGATFDRSFAYVGGYGWDRHLTYVMMTRHRESVNLYADKETYADYDALTKALSKHGMKDSVMDFPLHFAERRGLDTSALTRILPDKLAVRLNEDLQNLRTRYSQWINPKGFAYDAKKEAERLKNAQDRQIQREDARRVAAYMDAAREVGQCWQALNSTLHTFGIEALSFDAEEISLVKGTASWRAMETAKAKRNALAYELVQDIPRFTLGLDVNSVDSVKLVHFAEQHADARLVLNYLDEEKRGRVVHRDRMAASIQADIKRYYPYLKAQAIAPSVLRAQTKAHEKRLLFKTLSLDEKACFRLVADYHRLSMEVGKRFADYMKAKDESPLFSQSRTQDKTMLASSEERDRLAFLILGSRDASDKALSFFEIGSTMLESDSKFKTVAQAQKDAEARWYRLQQGAARHEIRSRIKAYHQALFVGDMAKRRETALLIAQDVKSYHGAVIGLHEGNTLTVNAFWQAIRQDAKQAAYLSHVAGLSDEAKAAYHLASRYAEAKRAHGQAWREILSEKEARNLDNETLYKILTPHTKRYTTIRNLVAAEIMRDASPQAFAHHSSALAYFEIDIATLKGQSQSHERTQTVTAYLNAYTSPQTSHIKRGEIAGHIISAPKDYHGAVMEAGLNWKTIYRDAGLYERYEAMKTFTADEKKLSRTARQYKALNQNIGKRYSRLKTAQDTLKNPCLEKDKKVLPALFSKRDYLADKLLNIMFNIDPTLPESAFDDIMRIKTDGLFKQARQHQERRERINAHQLAHENVLNRVGELYTALDLPEGLPKQSALMTALKPAQDALTFASGLKKSQWRENEKTLHYALSEAGLSASTWKKQEEMLEKLKKIVGELRERYHLKTFIPAVTHSQDIAPTSSRAPYSPLSKEAQERQDRINKVLTIVSQTLPIDGTVAETYLREHRHINNALHSENLRYHPALKNWMTQTVHPALIVIAKNEQGETIGLQATFLDPKTAQKAPLQKHTKLSRGLTGEGSLIHQGKKDGVMAYAEGLETALSVAEAHPEWNVHVTFGVNNFAKVPLKTDVQSIVLCVDNDGIESGTAKTVHKSAHRLAAQGKDVYVALPPKPEHIDKYDFNDLLKHEGKEAVKVSLDNRILYKDAVNAESLKLALSETLGINNSISEKTESSKQESNSDSLFSPDLQAILKNYAVMETRQSALVRTMHCHLSDDREIYAQASKDAIEHSKAVEAFALTATGHPDIVNALKKRLHFRAPSVAEAGGFSALSERLACGTATENDWATLLCEISSKANRSRSESRSRERGGRSL